jgi:hypothetical protein
MDWNDNRKRLVAIVFVFSVVGAVYGDDVIRLLYGVLGIEAQPWR